MSGTILDLRYAIVVVSIVNVHAMVMPVVALLAACSTLVPPMAGAQPDSEFYALQMRRLKEVLTAASAILVAGVSHMGAWLRWPAVLTPITMRTKPCWERLYPLLYLGA